MAKIQTIKNKDNVTVYPQTHTQAVYDADGKKLQEWMNEYLTAETIVDTENIDLNFESQGNKVTTIDENSTDAQYPSAKATYNLIVNKLGALDAGVKIEVVDALPDISEANSQYIYLVPATAIEDENVYDEYLLVGDSWEHLGTTTIDLTNYYTKTEADEKYAKLNLYDDTTINIGRKANTTIGIRSVAEGGSTTASGPYSHAEGENTQALSPHQHVQGKYNIADSNETYAHIVGNGVTDTRSSNAHTLTWTGEAWYQGDIYVGSTSGKNKDEGSKKLATEEYVNNKTISSTVDIGEGAALEAGTIYLVYEE
ncbi:MAG: hypothetical protein J6B87_06225 [Clostridia bacterium]|nr:hypothetical protein [Clostridia bacterium]